jgi:hypothetical protein
MRRRQQQEESIYDLIPQPVEKVKNPPRYKSKYPAKTPPTSSTFGRSTVTTALATNLSGDYEVEPKAHSWKKSGANFGTQKNHQADPTQYLKKSKKDLPAPSSFAYKQTIKPPVVKRNEKPEMGRRSERNYIKDNALEAIMTQPKKPAPETNYLKKEGYGQVPQYLNKVKAEVEAEKEYINQCIAAEQAYYQSAQPQMQLLDEAERVKLLSQLKDKWEEVNKAYQLQTHTLPIKDTIGSVRRKEAYETQLHQLEKNIEKLSKPYVFVQSDEYY